MRQLLKVQVKKVNGVYDPDTIRATLEGGGQFQQFLDNVPFRIKGINTPERRGGTELSKKLELKGRNRLKNLIEKSKKIEMILDGEKSFNRYHCNLILDGIDWSILVVQEKLGIQYSGEYSVKDYDWDEFVKVNHPELL